MLYTLDSEGAARPVPPIRTRNEAAELQTVLARNLDLLPGHQIDPESPRRWLLIREEMPVPDPGGAGSRWSVDLLLTDQSGVPTFVECKRYAVRRYTRCLMREILAWMESSGRGAPEQLAAALDPAVGSGRRTV